jgi:proteasome lid subunit RPN8/RPN11
MSDSLRLMPGIAEAIRQHGVETYPNECCGALIGSDGIVEHVAPLPNTTEEGARRRFLIRPSDYKVVEAEATRLKRELLGFYHSHPDHPARPSETDRQAAWPFYSYVIVSITNGEPLDMTSWLLDEATERFAKQEIVER